MHGYARRDSTVHTVECNDDGQHDNYDEHV